VNEFSVPKVDSDVVNDPIFKGDEENEIARPKIRAGNQIA